MHCPIRRVRISARASTVPQFRRAHHSATARFTTITPQGTPITRDIEIWLGEPAEAYVMFDPEISKAFQTSAIANGGCSLTQDLELCPLNFHHDTRHFSHTSSPYPRLEIPQDLPRQSDGNTSRATLHGYGVTHAITLDGTADETFHCSIRETLQRLGPVLNRLKNLYGIVKLLETIYLNHSILWSKLP
ncbi:hypothetical protein ONS96_014926 [Cadophora gregata f. sp. sojae]|nr:hypothetical protein ONS96_014926 [Cadophora gregata f. sp. sojae]